MCTKPFWGSKESCFVFVVFYLPASLNHRISVNGIFLLTDSHQGCFGDPLMWSLNTELLNKVWNCRNLRNWFIIQCHTSWFHSTNYPVTSQTVEGWAPHVFVPVPDWTEVCNWCQWNSRQNPKQRARPNSKANHVLVMLKRCVVPPFVESKRDEAYSGNAAIGNGPRACVFISICLYMFWCTAAPRLSSPHRAHINGQRQQSLYINRTYGWQLEMKRNGLNNASHQHVWLGEERTHLSLEF